MTGNLTLDPWTPRKRGRFSRPAPTAPLHAPANPPVVPLYELVNAGWVQPDRAGRPHWAETGKGSACGKKTHPPGELLDVLGTDERALPHGACRDCVSALVQRRFQTPFRIGQTVVSRAESMTLHGTVRAMFELDDEAWLNLDRIWLQEPRAFQPNPWEPPIEPDRGVTDWYRAAATCRPWDRPARR